METAPIKKSGCQVKGGRMAIVGKKAQKAIRKSVNRALKKTGMKKALKKYGPEIVAAVAASIASTLATLGNTVAPGSKGKKSNLAKLSKNAYDKLTPTKTRKRAASAKTTRRVTARQPEAYQEADELEG
jgi:hypothetical protein